MNRINPKRTLAVLLVAAALSAAALAKPPALDVSIGGGRAHALISLGFASVGIAFETGHDCPKSNGCTGTLL
ncbi:hypothetical protein AB2M62_02555 [Sphingomonas sp. MMS12-HWE2-04]|uniref:hypothetical protein n=1 Tax=Sphingomonas sp. MMS12-HWE2-04 TaxID=3234199 RepID=UPI00384FB2DB